MPNYKEMYLTLFHASEKAINILITAQKECEEIYITSHEPKLKIVETKKNTTLMTKKYGKPMR